MESPLANLHNMPGYIKLLANKVLKYLAAQYLPLQKSPAQTAAAPVKRGIITADARLGLLDCADRLLFVYLLNKRTALLKFLGFRVYPYPAKAVHPRQQVFAPFPLPAVKVVLAGMEMAAERLAALPAAKTAGFITFRTVNTQKKPTLHS